MPRIALLQMQSGIDPLENCQTIATALMEAAAQSAIMLFTPEMAILLDSDSNRSATSIHQMEGNPHIALLQDAATKAGIWLSIGSLALSDGKDGKRRNCSLVIDNLGQIRGHYDKLHLFDVDLPSGESWRESGTYAAGEHLAVVDTPCGRMGLSVCYDVRFPALYQALSGAGANILTIPAAFTVPTGKAHWQSLLRARAIENAAYVVAAAQSGMHADGRETYGHSLVIDPWGQAILDMGTDLGLGFAEISPLMSAEVRARIPVLAHRKAMPELRET
jgi:deaminated glutathione amidase